MAEAADKAQRIFQGFLARQASEAMDTSVDPLNVSAAFIDMYTQMLQNPGKLFEKQAELWKSYLDIWQHTTNKLLGEEAAPPIVAERSRDKRSRTPPGRRAPCSISSARPTSPRRAGCSIGGEVRACRTTARKIDFYTRQFVDAMRPAIS